MSDHNNGRFPISQRIVGALTGTPALLVIVILNIAMVVLAAWIWRDLESNRFAERMELLKMISQCYSGGGIGR